MRNDAATIIYRCLILACFLALFTNISQCQVELPATPQAAPTDQPEVLNFLVNRAGFGSAYNYGIHEWFQIWPINKKLAVIGPDVYMLEFNNVKRYRELAAGAGVEWTPNKTLTIDHEWYWEQGTGPDAHGAAWFIPWTRAELKLPDNVDFEIVAFPYFKLTHNATNQFVLERAKLEYQGFKHFNVGAGYGAYQDFHSTNWMSRPFVSATIKTAHMGSTEFWVQKFGNSAQLQVRHMCIWKSKGILPWSR